MVLSFFMVDACDTPHLGCGQSTNAETFLRRFLLVYLTVTKIVLGLCDVYMCLFLAYMTFLKYAFSLNCIASDEK